MTQTLLREVILANHHLAVYYHWTSPVHTRSYGKTKDRVPFKGEGDINGLAWKLQLSAAEFFAGNTSQERIGSFIGRIT